MALATCSPRKGADYFEVPLVAWLGASTLQLIGIILPKLQTPLADSFMGDVDPAFEQQLLYSAVTQGEAIITNGVSRLQTNKR